MRIMMFTHGYPPTLSGVTLVVQKIARAMVARGHQVLVITASERRTPYQDQDQGVQLERVFGLPNLFWREGPIPILSPSAIHQLAQKFKPDLIHTHENLFLSNSLLHVNWNQRPILITSCHSLPRYVTHYLPLGRLDPILEAIVWKILIHNLNQFEQVVFCTRTHEREFLAHGLCRPTIVISNGVNIQRYHPQKDPGEDIEQRYALPPPPRILSVGRLMKDKKIDLLIEAMSRVCTRREVHLLIVGRGAEHARIKALSQKLDLEPYIHILGYVPEPDLPQLYRACDLFAIPSIVEVQSLPALQAAATGLPIVAANSAALPELVWHGENGLLVHPLNADELGEAILYIIEHPDEARRMGQVSLRIASAHDEQKTFQAYEDFYLRMAETNRSPR